MEAKTYFRATDQTKTGTFRAMFESMLDSRESVTGTFVVAQFRYVYASVLEGGGKIVPSHDEGIYTVILDCKAHLAGTISVTYNLAGKLVSRDDTPDDRVLLTQDASPSMVNDLCEFLGDTAAGG